MNIWIKEIEKEQYSTTLVEVKGYIDSGVVDPETTYAWYIGLEEWIVLKTLVPPAIVDKLIPKETIVKKNPISISEEGTNTFISSKANKKSNIDIILEDFSSIGVFTACLFIASLTSQIGRHSGNDVKDGAAGIWICIIGVCIFRRITRIQCEKIIITNKEIKPLNLYTKSILKSLGIVVLMYLGASVIHITLHCETYQIGEVFGKLIVFYTISLLFGMVFSVGISNSVARKNKSNPIKNVRVKSTLWLATGLGTIILILFTITSGVIRH
jgi:hypothetical protein